MLKLVFEIVQIEKNESYFCESGFTRQIGKKEIERTDCTVKGIVVDTILLTDCQTICFYLKLFMSI